MASIIFSRFTAINFSSILQQTHKTKSLLNLILFISYIFIFIIYQNTSVIFADSKESIFYQHLKFKAFQKDEFAFKVDYLIKEALYKNQEVIDVYVHLYGAKIEEETVCFLSKDVYKLLYVYQNTNNQYDNAYFTWEIDNTDVTAKSHYYNLSNRELISETFNFPQVGYTIQAWLFRLLKTDITKKSAWKFKLLVPRNTFYNITAKVIDIEEINLDSNIKKCFKVEAGVAGLLGVFAPKIYFWITAEKPHQLVKYQDYRFIYLIE